MPYCKRGAESGGQEAPRRLEGGFLKHAVLGAAQYKGVTRAVSRVTYILAGWNLPLKDLGIPCSAMELSGWCSGSCLCRNCLYKVNVKVKLVRSGTHLMGKPR